MASGDNPTAARWRMAAWFLCMALHSLLGTGVAVSPCISKGAFAFAPKGKNCATGRFIRTRYECEYAAQCLGLVEIDYDSRKRPGDAVGAPGTKTKASRPHGCYWKAKARQRRAGIDRAPELIGDPKNTSTSSSRLVRISSGPGDTKISGTASTLPIHARAASPLATPRSIIRSVQARSVDDDDRLASTSGESCPVEPVDTCAQGCGCTRGYSKKPWTVDGETCYTCLRSSSSASNTNAADGGGGDECPTSSSGRCSAEASCSCGSGLTRKAYNQGACYACDDDDADGANGAGCPLTSSGYCSSKASCTCERGYTRQAHDQGASSGCYACELTTSSVGGDDDDDATAGTADDDTSTTGQATQNTATRQSGTRGQTSAPPRSSTATAEPGRTQGGSLWFNDEGSAKGGASIDSSRQAICTTGQVCSAKDVHLVMGDETMFDKEDAADELIVAQASDASFGPQAYEPFSAQAMLADQSDQASGCTVTVPSKEVGTKGTRLSATGNVVVISIAEKCCFASAVLSAQKLGAIGVVVLTRETRTMKDHQTVLGLWRMLSYKLATVEQITIPVVAIESHWSKYLLRQLMHRDGLVARQVVVSFDCGGKDYITAAPGYSVVGSGSYTVAGYEYGFMAGSVCDADLGYEPIKSQAECSGAAKKIIDGVKAKVTDEDYFNGIKDTSANSGSTVKGQYYFSWPNRYPHGCYYRCGGKDGKHLYWNHAGYINADKQDLTRRVICRTPSTAPSSASTATTLANIRAKYPADLFQSKVTGRGGRPRVCSKEADCDGTYCWGETECIPKEMYEPMEDANVDVYKEYLAADECARQFRASREAAESGKSDRCQNHDTFIACARAAWETHKYTSTAETLDPTGGVCYAKEKTFEEYKKVAIADGCKPHDPFADDECESWFEQMFGINLLEVFGLDEVIDGVVEIVGTVGRPLVRVALDVIDEIEDALCFWCEGPAEAPPPALPSGCTETAKILTDKGTLVTKRKVVSTVTTTNKETGETETKTETTYEKDEEEVQASGAMLHTAVSPVLLAVASSLATMLAANEVDW